jgi:arylsulfatase A-like enzyme
MVPAATSIVLSLLVIHPSAMAQSTGQKPNILFIFTDDHAAQAVGAYGSRINKTPNLDRIAREGMLFRNAFCTNSICAPSRAVILTGLHSHLNGQLSNKETFDGTQRTFPKLLQGAGYQTAMIGKWHLKSEPTGFNYWEVLPGQGHYYNPDFRTPKGKVRYEGYVTDIVTDRALGWLEDGRDQDAPFLLMLQHKAPHRNWMPSPEHLNLYDDEFIWEPPTLFDDYSGRASPASNQAMTIDTHMMKAYDLKVSPPDPSDARDVRTWGNVFGRLTDEQKSGWDAAYGPKNEKYRPETMTKEEIVRWKYQRYIKDYLRCIASVDDNVGRVLDYLDESGLAENTIVVYTSDQGFYLGEHGWFDKRWMYEESLRMPLMVRWPGSTAANSSDEHLVQNLDFAPTFLEMAGVDIPAAMQGESLVPILTGEHVRDWRKSIYYQYYEFPGAHNVARHYGVRTDRYKLIHYYESDEWELIDLERDPQELKSVYSDEAYTSIRIQLETELDRLRALYKKQPDEITKPL